MIKFYRTDDRKIHEEGGIVREDGLIWSIQQ